MTLVRFKNDLNPRFNTLLDSFFDTPISEFFSDSSIMRQIPAVNIKETESEYSVEVAAPGLKKEDFKISLEKDVLMISSEKEAEEKSENDGYTRKEFSYSSFKRSLKLPEQANKEEIQASYDQGILIISIPKNVIKEETSRFIDIT